MGWSEGGERLLMVSIFRGWSEHEGGVRSLPTVDGLQTGGGGQLFPTVCGCPWRREKQLAFSYFLL